MFLGGSQGVTVYDCLGAKSDWRFQGHRYKGEEFTSVKLKNHVSIEHHPL